MPTTLRESLAILLAVQAVDSLIDRARATLAALDTGATTAAAYNTGKAEFEKLKTTALKAQAAQRDAELALQTIETKTAQVNKSLYDGTVVAARELSNLQKELEMLGRQKGDSEEKVLAAMEAASNATTIAQTREAELTALAESYRKIRATYKEQSAVLAKEISVLEVERAKTAKPVPVPLLARYDTIRTKRGGGIGIAALNNDITCSACHTHLNETLVEAIRAADVPQICEHCGRLLALAPLP